MKILLTLTVVLLGCTTTTSHYGQLVDRCKATWGKDSLEFDECLHAARVSVGSPGLQSVIDRKNARIKKELEKYMAHLDREVGAKRMKRSEAMMAYNKMFKEKAGDVPWVSEHMAYVALLEERVEAGDLSRAEAG